MADEVVSFRLVCEEIGDLFEVMTDSIEDGTVSLLSLCFCLGYLQSLLDGLLDWLEVGVEGGGSE